MTRVFLDSREIAIPPGSPLLNRILHHVEQVHLSPDSAVREIRINGISPLPVPRGEPGLPLKIGRDARIDLFTGPAREMAGESIRDALSFLDRIEAISPCLIESFEESPDPGSFEKLKQLWEGLYWLDILSERLKTDWKPSD